MSGNNQVLDLLQEILQYLDETLRDEKLSVGATHNRDILVQRLKTLIAEGDYGSLDLNIDKRDRSATDDSESFHYIKGTAVPEKSAQEISKTCRLSGFLEKRGKEFLGKVIQSLYVKRWCALCDDILYYYDKSSDKRPRGSIAIRDCFIRIPALKDSAKRECAFELVSTTGKHHLFVAPTASEAQQWIAILEPYCCAAQNTKASFGGLYGGSEGSEFEGRESAVIDDDELDVDDDYDDYDDSSDTGTDAKIPSDYDLWFVAQWDFTARHDDELSLRRGELVRLIDKQYENDGWWTAQSAGGQVGFVPKRYLVTAYVPKVAVTS